MAATENPGSPARRANYPAVSRARAARARAVVLAEGVAGAEEKVALTLARLADRYPDDADRLRAASESLGQQAARKRQWARDHLRVTAQHPDTARVPPPGPMSPPSVSGAVVGTAARRMEARAQRLMVVRERDRIATEIQDRIVRRIFAAGFALQSAAGLASQPDVRSRIDTAAAELDQALHEIREVVFGLGENPHRW